MRRGRRGVGVSGTVGTEAGSVSRVRTRVKMESEVAKDWMRSKLSRMGSAGRRRVVVESVRWRRALETQSP